MSQFKVYLLRTSTLQPRGGNFALGWKQSPRGAVDGARPEDSTPTFAEMAAPGTVFEGHWDEKSFFLQPEVRRSVRWPEVFQPRAGFSRRSTSTPQACWRCSGNTHRGPVWACSTRASIELEQRLAAAREKGACLLCLGWGGGLTAKSAWLDTTNADYRQILQQLRDSTTARWRRICRSRRRAASCS